MFATNLKNIPHYFRYLNAKNNDEKLRFNSF